jgi:hypothetical protein
MMWRIILKLGIPVGLLRKRYKGKREFGGHKLDLEWAWDFDNNFVNLGGFDELDFDEIAIISMKMMTKAKMW